jgi:hypothetical protein
MVTSRSQQAARASRRLLHPGGRHSAAGRSGILSRVERAVCQSHDGASWGVGERDFLGCGIAQQPALQEKMYNMHMYMVYMCMYMLLSCDVPYRIRRTRRPLSAPHATGFGGKQRTSGRESRSRRVPPRRPPCPWRPGVSLVRPAAGPPRRVVRSGGTCVKPYAFARRGARGRGGAVTTAFICRAQKIFSTWISLQIVCPMCPLETL